MKTKKRTPKKLNAETWTLPGPPSPGPGYDVPSEPPSRRPWVQLYFEISLLSFIHKIFEQNSYLYTTVYLLRIWTYKIADEKVHTFSRSKNVKKNGRKTDTV